MQKHVKTAVIVLVVGFALYYLVTQPVAAANFVKSLFAAFLSIFTFFGALAS